MPDTKARFNPLIPLSWSLLTDIFHAGFVSCLLYFSFIVESPFKWIHIFRSWFHQLVSNKLYGLMQSLNYCFFHFPVLYGNWIYCYLNNWRDSHHSMGHQSSFFGNLFAVPVKLYNSHVNWLKTTLFFLFFSFLTGACITHDWNPGCTHVLADESSTVSEELMDAIVLKKPVVTSDWVKVSCQTLLLDFHCFTYCHLLYHFKRCCSLKYLNELTSEECGTPYDSLTLTDPSHPSPSPL